MPAESVLHCRACGHDSALTEPVFRCPKCDGLFEVVHDPAHLAARDAEGWKALFDARLGRPPYPYRSGVWNKHEWVMPDVPPGEVVSLGEGNSPLVAARRYAREVGLGEVFIKQCGTSHTGSFKDLGMTVLVSTVKWAMSRGLPVRALACASTGDTSAALAAYGAAAGVPVVVLLPAGKVSTAQLVQPLAAGALVLALDTDFDGCMEIIRRLAAEGHVYLANSMNPLRLEGQKTVALEMVQQLDWQVPDWVVVPGGNLGNAGALFEGFSELKRTGVTARLPRICVAQAEAADPLYRAWQRPGRALEPVRARATLATAIQIGNPVSFSRAVAALEATDGLVESASEDELAEAAARIDRTGFYACPHTAVALACLEKLAARGVVGEGERVVVVSTASGLKFTEFKSHYHEKALPGLACALANAPVPVLARYGEVVDAIRERSPRAASGGR